ncbi:hypothetical protein MRB53_020289 [Persea americana]|uniref:Uncharacterized protein n=1 Tax=Persea americana TaxID=3435 RepID=A0ACC2L0H2_PERAE|nr:hypothetical protein MRB53_020289 [Persea americana]
MSSGGSAGFAGFGSVTGELDSPDSGYGRWERKGGRFPGEGDRSSWRKISRIRHCTIPGKQGETFAGMISDAGFQKVEYENLVGGVMMQNMPTWTMWKLPNNYPMVLSLQLLVQTILTAR